jgi:hypothetical protein
MHLRVILKPTRACKSASRRTANPYLGKPDALVVLEEWNDYLCLFCERHFQQTLLVQKDEYIRASQMQLAFQALPFAFFEFNHLSFPKIRTA